MDNTIVIKLSKERLVAILDVNMLLGIDDIKRCSIKLNGSLSDFFKINHLRINSQYVTNDTNTTFDIEADKSHAIYTFSLDTFENYDNVNSAKFELEVDDNTYVIDIQAFDDTLCNFDTYSLQGKQIDNDMSSSLLLRTNPKLTGNIKLVVDNDYNIYLDTFKVSSTSILNKRMYRHQKVSSDGNYPHDVYMVFKDIPNGELFKVHSDAYDPHKVYYDMWEQIDDTYEYGAQTNSDQLYSEDLRILAPLYIGKDIPQYFAIFRNDDIVNIDTYSDIMINDLSIFKDRIANSKVIKIFDLRNNTSIGHYLNAYKDSVQPYINGQVYLQFIEQDSTDTHKRQGQNTWYGISVDKGLLTKKIETTYFATQTLNGEHPQERYSNFILNGFERNNLLYPNILNLEFMFNDDEVEQFSMHNYFGLYLTENDFINLDCVIKSQVNNEKLTYYDKDNNAYNKNQLKFSIVDDAKYQDRLFFMTTHDQVGDMKTIDDIDNFTKQYVTNHPLKNVCNIVSEEMDFDDVQSFMVLKFTKPINYGEHFRFIFVNHNNEGVKENVVFEVVASNDERLIYSKNNINPYIQTNTPEKRGMVDDNTKIYRLNFYTQSLDNKEVTAPLAEQIKRFKACIAKFDSFLYVKSYNDDTMSILSTEKNSYFQHIDNTIRDVNTPTYDDYSYDEQYKDAIRYFTFNHEVSMYMLDYENIRYLDNHLPFALNGFEILGNRYNSITQFIYLDDYDEQYFYQIDKDIYQEIKNINHPLANTINGYFPLTSITYKSGYIHTPKVKKEDSYLTFDNYSTFLTISPMDVNKSMVAIPYKAHLNNGYFNICSPTSTTLSIMGINQVRDLDTRVDYTSEVEIANSTSLDIKANTKLSLNDVNGLRYYRIYCINKGNIQHIPTGTNVKFMFTPTSLYYVYNNDVQCVEYTNDYIYTLEDTTISIEANTNEFSFVDKLPVFFSDNYYKDSENKQDSTLDIPIVPLVNMRWKSNGQYADGNNLLDTDYLTSQYEQRGYFIENTYNISDNEQYVKSTMNDLLPNGMDVKEFITSCDYTFPIKKVLTSTYKLPTAICYYNEYIQTLEFIYSGIRYNIKFTSPEYKDLIKLSQFNNYEVFVVNDYNDNVPNDMYISIDEEFILVINHSYDLGGTNPRHSILKIDNDMNTGKYAQYDGNYTYELIDTAWLPSTLSQPSYCFRKSDDVSDVDAYAYIQQDLDVYDDGFYYTKGQSIDNPIYFYMDIDNEYFTSGDIYDKMGCVDYVMVTDIDDLQTKVSDHVNNDLFKKTYASSTIDYKKSTSYVLKETKEPLSLTFKEKLDRYMALFDTNSVNIYTIENGVTTLIESTSDYRPLLYDLAIPSNVKYNNGLFMPSFVDIFEYSLNDDISSELDIDLLGCNTQVTSISSIKNYTSNKVLDDKQQCVYNYFESDERMMFTSCWDNHLYRLYSNDATYKNMYGYSLGIADKTFFGTMCINLQYPELYIRKWDYDKSRLREDKETSKFNVNDKATIMYTLKINVTKVFYDMMMNNQAFINNWVGNINTTDYQSSVNNYINNTLLRYYNFESEQVLTLYRKYDINKKSDASPWIYDEPSDFESDYSLVTGFQNDYEVVNGDVYLTIKLSDYSYYYYYPILKIKKY